MIIPRQYFNQQTPQAQMQQAPMTQAPQRGTADTGRAKAEESLFESMEGLFAKLGGVAAKAEKSNQALKTKEIERQQDIDAAKLADELRYNQIPNWKTEDLNTKGLTDYLKNTHQFDKPIEYSKNKDINKSANTRLKLKRQGIIGSALSDINVERKFRLEQELEIGRADALSEFLIHSLKGEIPWQKVAENELARYSERFTPFVNQNLIEKDLIKNYAKGLVNSMALGQAEMDYNKNPKAFSALTLEQVLKKYSYDKQDIKGNALADKLVQIWSREQEVSKNTASTIVDTVIKTTEPYLLKQRIQDKTGDFYQWYNVLDSESKILVDQRIKAAVRNYNSTLALGTLKDDMATKESMYKKYIKVVDGKVIPNQIKLKQDFPSDVSKVRSIVENAIQEKKNSEQETRLLNASRIESNFKLGRLTYEKAKQQIEAENLHPQDRLNLNYLIEETRNSENENSAARSAEYFLSTPNKQDEFLKSYEKYRDTSGKLKDPETKITDDMTPLEQNIVSMSDASAARLLQKATGEVNEIVRTGHIGEVNNLAADVRTSNEVKKLRVALKSHKYLSKNDKTALDTQLGNLERVYIEKEAADTERSIAKKDSQRKAEISGQIQTAENLDQLPTDEEIDADTALSTLSKTFIKTNRLLAEKAITLSDNDERTKGLISKFLLKAARIRPEEHAELYSNIIADIQSLNLEQHEKDDLTRILTDARTVHSSHYEAEREKENRNQKALNAEKISSFIKLQDDPNKIIQLLQMLEVGDAVKIGYADLGTEESVDLSIREDNQPGGLSKMGKELLNTQARLKALELETNASKPDPQNLEEQQFFDRIDRIIKTGKSSKEMSDAIKEIDTYTKAKKDAGSKYKPWLSRLKTSALQARDHWFNQEDWSKLTRRLNTLEGAQELLQKGESILGSTGIYKHIAPINWLKIQKGAHDTVDRFTPDPVENVDAELNKYARYLINETFFTKNTIRDPLQMEDHEKHTLETRLGVNIQQFKDLDIFSNIIQLQALKTIRLTDPSLIRSQMNDLDQVAKGNRHKMLILNMWKDLAEDRIASLSPDNRGATLFIDAYIENQNHGEANPEDPNITNIGSKRWIPAQKIRVIDGDTIEVLGEDGVYRSVRFGGINTKEMVTPTSGPGLAAKQALADYFKKPGFQVRIIKAPKGHYGRDVGWIWTNENQLLNAVMVDRNFSPIIDFNGVGTFDTIMRANESR